LRAIDFFGGRVITLTGCGHMMMAEQPNEVLDALISIL
jgi:pimeloyl-ACP methyl ester carboxylesterase